MSLLGSGSLLYAGRNAKRPAPQGSNAANTTCQRCLQKGHWTWQCTNERAYTARPSRTEQLLNPKVRPAFMSESDLLPEDQPEKPAVAPPKAKKRKVEASSSSSSSSSSSDDSSDSSSSSGSGSSSSSSSSSDSDSDSSSSDSEDAKPRAKPAAKSSKAAEVDALRKAAISEAAQREASDRHRGRTEGEARSKHAGGSGSDRWQMS